MKNNTSKKIPFGIFGFFALLLVFQACKTKAPMLPTQTNKPFITIGNGGGFTGAISTFYLMEDGSLYRTGFDDTSFVFIGALENNLSDQMFTNYKSLNLDKIELDEPGNRYYFLSINDNGKEKKLLWGKNKIDNKNITIYHKNLMDLIRKKSNDEKDKPLD